MPPKYSRELSEPIAFGSKLREQFRTSPCEDACPAGNSIQKMQELVEKGNYTEGLRYLLAKNPFPGITGRVCPHFCMQKCNRLNLEGSINIRSLERFCADNAQPGTLLFKNRPSTGKKIAIVGGGPAGLTSAWFLALLGHAVTVYESSPMLGGLPRYGVPGFRLPRDVVDREIGNILARGVTARVNTKVGTDISLQEIRERNDAIIIATGLPLENILQIPGAEYAFKAIEFLYKAAMGIIDNAKIIGKTVVIMGGGGTAFDCAFVAKRLGAKEVHLIFRKKTEDLSTPKEDILLAQKDGIYLHQSANISGIKAENGKVIGIDYYDVQNYKLDDKGRSFIEPKPDATHELACDMVIFAVGIKPNLDFTGDMKLNLTSRGWLDIDDNLQTNIPGIFAAGDIATGPSSIAQAIGNGRYAAFAIHACLTSDKSKVYAFNDENMLEARDDLAGLTAPYVVPFSEIHGIDQYEYAEPAEEKINTCTKIFAELNLGLDEMQAKTEAARCMHCGHCKSCGTCVADCPGYVLEMIERKGSLRPEVEFGDECWHCANCRTSCPTGAIGFVFPLRMQV